jgi:bifunctional non-homologous end joining protein LigD
VRSIIIHGEAVWCKHDGEDYRNHPLEKRKTKLEKLVARTQGMRFSEHLDGNGEIIFDRACKMGLEGIVSNRLDLPASVESKSWVKIKNPASPAVLQIEDGT